MLNVDKVFTSTWTSLERVRNYIKNLKSSMSSDLSSDQVIDLILDSLDVSRTTALTPSSPFADFQTNNGIIIPDTSSCLEIAKDMYRASCGEDIDTTPQSHIGRMIEQTAKFIASGVGITAANIMQHDINSATGAYLDAIGSWFLVNRKVGRATSVVYTMVRKEGITDPIRIYASDLSFTDGNGVVFKGNDDIVISDALSIANIEFFAQESGPIEINMTGLDFSKAIKEVCVCSLKLGSITIGYDEEDDDAYRKRIKESRAKSVGFMESIHSALYGIDGVRDVLVLENTTSEIKTFEQAHILMPPHSICVIVDYNNADSVSRQIAKAIYEHKSQGCGYTAIRYEKENQTIDQSVTITYEDPYFHTPYDIVFNAPGEVKFEINIAISKNKYVGVDIDNEVYNAIVRWAAGGMRNHEGLRIGESVKAFEIGAAVSLLIPDIQIDGVTVSTLGGTGALSVPISESQIGHIAKITLHEGDTSRIIFEEGGE